MFIAASCTVAVSHIESQCEIAHKQGNNLFDLKTKGLKKSSFVPSQPLKPHQADTCQLLGWRDCILGN